MPRVFVLVALLLIPVTPSLAQLRGHGGPVRALAISPDGTRAVSGSFDTAVIRWSLQRNAAEQVLRFHEGAVNAVALLKDGRIATSGEDGRVAIWTPGATAPSTVLEGHKAPVVALAVSADGTMLASASWDHTARIWPLAGGAPRVFEGHAQNVNGVAFTPDSRSLVTAGYDATLRIWPLAGGAPVVVDAADTAQHGRCRARRGNHRGRRGRQGVLSFSCGRTERHGGGRADADHFSRGLGRRQARRRGRHPRLRCHHRSRRAQDRAHAGRPRLAGLVGGVLSRQPHAADGRRRPHASGGGMR